MYQLCSARLLRSRAAHFDLICHLSGLRIGLHKDVQDALRMLFCYWIDLGCVK